MPLWRRKWGRLVTTTFTGPLGLVFGSRLHLQLPPPPQIPRRWWLALHPTRILDSLASPSSPARWLARRWICKAGACSSCGCSRWAVWLMSPLLNGLMKMYLVASEPMDWDWRSIVGNTKPQRRAVTVQLLPKVLRSLPQNRIVEIHLWPPCFY